MKPKSKISLELYQMLLDRGYQERFCDLVTQKKRLEHSNAVYNEYLNSRKTED